MKRVHSEYAGDTEEPEPWVATGYAAGPPLQAVVGRRLLISALAHR